VSAISEFLDNNETYASGFSKGSLPMPPAKKIAVVACMDARLETGALLGLVEGDAHVIRNAGGVVTDDVIRSLTISQRLLGTREIMLIHHTDCGMLTLSSHRSPWRPSPIWTQTFDNPSRGSKRTHTFHSKTRFAASSTKPSPADFARSRNCGVPRRSNSKVSEMKSSMIGSIELLGLFAERETDVISSD